MIAGDSNSLRLTAVSSMGVRTGKDNKHNAHSSNVDIEFDFRQMTAKCTSDTDIETLPT